MKKFVSKFVALMMAVMLVPVFVPMTVSAADSIDVYVKATQSAPYYVGDVIDFTVGVGAVTELGAGVMRVDLPAGLTYVSGSMAIAEGTVASLECSVFELVTSGGLLGANWYGFDPFADSYFSTDSGLDLLTFKVTVAESARNSQLSVALLGTATIGNINNVPFDLNLISDVIAVEDEEGRPTPTATPTPTEEATPTAVPTATAVPTSTPTAEPTATPTAEPTNTPVPTATDEPTSTPKPTNNRVSAPWRGGAGGYGSLFSRPGLVVVPALPTAVPVESDPILPVDPVIPPVVAPVLDANQPLTSIYSVLQSSLPAGTKVGAVLSSNTLIINGVATNLPAYNIDGYNWLKLRDIAALLNYSSKQFAVSYNQATDTVVINTGSAYMPVGDELQPLSGDASAIVSPQNVIINGVPMSIAAYNINDYNYFRLRDIAILLNLNVIYDAATGAIQLDLASPYAE